MKKALFRFKLTHYPRLKPLAFALQCRYHYASHLFVHVNVRNEQLIKKIFKLLCNWARPNYHCMRPFRRTILV